MEKGKGINQLSLCIKSYLFFMAFYTLNQYILNYE